MTNRLRIAALGALAISLHLSFPFACRAAQQDFVTSLSAGTLRHGDLDGLIILKEDNRPWAYTIDSRNMPVERMGVRQECRIGNISVRLQSVDFPTTEAAERAAEFHATNMAAAFRKVLPAQTEYHIGDTVWITDNAGNYAVLMRVERTCVLISCSDLEFRLRQDMALSTARKIAQKIRTR